MDLYFHRSPKKRMLSLSALKKKKTSTVGPEQQERKLTVKSPSITDFLSKKVSSIQAKKIWNQIVPQYKSAATSTVLFDSNDHLADVASIPPTPPPKKSATMPNLSIITDTEIINRALPSLPSVENSISIGSQSSSRNGLTRATTWVGKSIQKWLSNLDEQRKAAIMDISDFEHDGDDQDALYSSSLLPNALDQKLTLHCRSKYSSTHCY